MEQPRARGDSTGAERADREPGEKVDTEREAELLAELRGSGEGGDQVLVGSRISG